jgi:hypothetical protein
MKARLPFLLLLPPLLLSALASCRPQKVAELPREELFSLAMGKMDNQLDLSQNPGLSYAPKNCIYMRDGLFFLANGNSAKIMELSSYGDLIFLLYDPAVNPPPVSFSTESSDSLAATRKAVAYPLRQIGELAVDSGKRLFVADTVGEERQLKDEELNVLLSRVILRFDRHGKLLDFIGQEGVGGTPFPYIDSLQVTANDELVVVCRTPRYWQVFWYSAAGGLLHQFSLDPRSLPGLEGAPAVVPALGKLVPDLNRRLLYAVLYFFNPEAAEAAKDPARAYVTRVYRLDAATGELGDHFDVPQDAARREAAGSQGAVLPPPSYELLGVNTRGAFYLLRREDSNLFQLLVLDRAGKPAARRYLVVEDSELYFKLLGISAEGIIYALLGEEFRARVVWWRSDKLLKEEASEGG